MHDIIVTQGLVLKKRAVGEANILVSILTEQLGLVRAIVRSARGEKSKLRYGAEVGTRGRFSLVRGRHEWRLVGVECTVRHLTTLSTTKRSAIGRVSFLLLRLIQGQEAVPELYKTVEGGLASLYEVDNLNLPSIECLLVLRILARLGYIPHIPELTPFISSDIFSPELVEMISQSRPLLVRTINESLKASEL